MIAYVRIIRCVYDWNYIGTSILHYAISFLPYQIDICKWFIVYRLRMDSVCLLLINYSPRMPPVLNENNRSSGHNYVRDNYHFPYLGQMNCVSCYIVCYVAVIIMDVSSPAHDDEVIDAFSVLKIRPLYSPFCICNTVLYWIIFDRCLQF